MNKFRNWLNADTEHMVTLSCTIMGLGIVVMALLGNI